MWRLRKLHRALGKAIQMKKYINTQVTKIRNPDTSDGKFLESIFLSDYWPIGIFIPNSKYSRKLPAVVKIFAGNTSMEQHYTDF